MIPSEKDGDARVKTGSQLFNSRFAAALVSLFRDSSIQQRSMTLFITWHAILSSILRYIVPSLKDLPFQLLANPYTFSSYLSAREVKYGFLFSFSLF